MTDIDLTIPDFLIRTDKVSVHKSRVRRLRPVPVMPVMGKRKSTRWLPKHMDAVSHKLLREIELAKEHKQAERIAYLRSLAKT